MRCLNGTAPLMGPSAAGEPLCAAGRTGAHPARTAAAAVFPMVSRNARRLGSEGPGCSRSSIQFPFRKQLTEPNRKLFTLGVYMGTHEVGNINRRRCLPTVWPKAPRLYFEFRLEVV